MPNHVTTIIKADPSVIAGITRETTDEERASVTWGDPVLRLVDFELVVPSPENKETDGCTGQHEPGVVCWYSWNTENWGTKWGAYDAEFPEDHLIHFDTAWSHPFPVVVALSKKFPEHHIEVSFADEDLGSNLGQYVILNGEIVQQTDIVPQSDEALDFASQVKYGKTYAEMRVEGGDDDDGWDFTWISKSSRLT